MKTTMKTTPTTLKNSVSTTIATTTQTPIYNNCMCVTNGSCSIVGGNSTVINDGTGQIDVRIVNVRFMKERFGESR